VVNVLAAGSVPGSQLPAAATTVCTYLKDTSCSRVQSLLSFVSNNCVSVYSIDVIVSVSTKSCQCSKDELFVACVAWQKCRSL